MNTRKAMAIVIVAALVIIGVGAWIMWDVLYIDTNPFIIGVCVMFAVVGIIIFVSYPKIKAYYWEEYIDEKVQKKRPKKAYIFLALYIVILAVAAVVLTMEEKFDISYSVDDEVSEYTLYGETYGEYKVSIDIETFDTSSQPEFNKRIAYLYKQVIKGDGFDRHVIFIYEQITDEPYTVAMVTDGHEWKNGWLITPNDEFYDELFDTNE